LITEAKIIEKLSSHFPEFDFQVTLSIGKVNIAFLKTKVSFWLDDWISKNDIILGIIQSILGKNEKIFARNCDVIKLDKELTERFLNENHLLGFKTAYHKIGLLHNNELKAVATFSKGRKMDRLSYEKRSFELVSFCCKKGFSVIGGLSKLITHFVAKTQPGDVMTYIDKDWSNGTAYLNLGFKIHSEIEPLTFVFDQSNFVKYHIEKLPEDILKALQSNNENLAIVKNAGNLKLVYTL